MPLQTNRWPRRGRALALLVVGAAMTVAAARIWSRWSLPAAVNDSRAATGPGPADVDALVRALPARARGTPHPRETRRAADVASAFARERTNAAPGAWIAAGDRTPWVVVAPGPLGSWDDFKIDSPVVRRAPDGTFTMWFRGCRFSGGVYGCGVGRATSADGVAWTIRPQPVFVPADPYDRAHLTAIAVAASPREYRLWYSVDAAWTNGRRPATVYMARSADGVAWTSPSRVYTGVAPSRPLFPAAAFAAGAFHVWLVDSRSPLDPTTNRFPPMPPEGDEMLLHFISSDNGALTAEGGVPIERLRIDPLPMSIVALDSGGFRALLYEQHPIGATRQGFAVLRSPDGTTWERRDDEGMPFGVGNLGSRVVPVSIAALDAPAALLGWIVQRDRRGADSIVAAFRRDVAR